MIASSLVVYDGELSRSWPLLPLSAVLNRSVYLLRFFQSVMSGCLSARYFGTNQPMWPTTPRSPPSTTDLFSSTYSCTFFGAPPQSSMMASTLPLWRASKATDSSSCFSSALVSSSFSRMYLATAPLASAPTHDGTAMVTLPEEPFEDEEPVSAAPQALTPVRPRTTTAAPATRVRRGLAPLDPVFLRSAGCCFFMRMASSLSFRFFRRDGACGGRCGAGAPRAHRDRGSGGQGVPVSERVRWVVRSRTRPSSTIATPAVRPVPRSLFWRP